MFYDSIISRKLPGFFVTAPPPGYLDERVADTLRLVYALPILRSVSINQPCSTFGSPSNCGASTCTLAEPASDELPAIEQIANTNNSVSFQRSSNLVNSNLLCRGIRFQYEGKEDRGVPAGLCSRCLSVDWSLLTSKRPSDHFARLCGIDVFELDDRHTLMQSNCPMCRFIGTSMAEITGQRGSARLKLKAAGLDGLAKLIATTYVVGDYRSMTKTWLSLGILPPPREDHDRSWGPGLLSPSDIDFTLLGDWIRRCQESHIQCIAQSVPEEISKFRLIDCTTKMVVESSVSWDYIALSYVWGSATFDPYAKWPLVVEDSITVTLALKHRYLWVDRYVRHDAFANIP